MLTKGKQAGECVHINWLSPCHVTSVVISFDVFCCSKYINASIDWERETHCNG